MEMSEMMAAWLAEVDRIQCKKEPLTLVEEFFINLTLEFDWTRNHQPHNVHYLNFLLETVDRYISGMPDEAMANFLSLPG